MTRSGVQSSPAAPFPAESLKWSPCGFAGPSGPSSSVLILHFATLRSGHLRARSRACGRFATVKSGLSGFAQTQKKAAVLQPTPMRSSKRGPEGSTDVDRRDEREACLRHHRQAQPFRADRAFVGASLAGGEPARLQGRPARAMFLSFRFPGRLHNILKKCILRGQAGEQ